MRCVGAVRSTGLPGRCASGLTNADAALSMAAVGSTRSVSACIAHRSRIGQRCSPCATKFLEHAHEASPHSSGDHHDLRSRSHGRRADGRLHPGSVRRRRQPRHHWAIDGLGGGHAHQSLGVPARDRARRGGGRELAQMDFEIRERHRVGLRHRLDRWDERGRPGHQPPLSCRVRLREARCATGAFDQPMGAICPRQFQDC